MLTIIKITPFYLISLIKLNLILIYFILIICSCLPPYIILNLINFKIIISYSSINQSGWIIFLIFFKTILWWKYFIFYSFISLCLFNLIYYFKIFLYNNNFIYNYNQIYLSYIPLIFIFNIAGLPPFSFFYIKWYRIFFITYNSDYLIIFIILILRSLILFYIYTNIMISSIFFYKFKSKLHHFKFSINIFHTFIIYLTLFISSILFLI